MSDTLHWLVSHNCAFLLLFFRIRYLFHFLSAHEKPLHFKSLKEKADAILEYANTLDTERKKGNELYESILDSM